MLGLYTTPHLSAILLPSSSTSRLHFTKTPARSSHVPCALPSSALSKTKRVFAKMNGCATSFSSILDATLEIQKALPTHACDISKGHPHPCMPRCLRQRSHANPRYCSLCSRRHRRADIRMSDHANMRRQREAAEVACTQEQDGARCGDLAWLACGAQHCHPSMTHLYKPKSSHIHHR